MAFLSSCSIVSPVGSSTSTCGYCSPPGLRSTAKTSRSFGIWAHDLSPWHYQALIDQGWRRSGKYVYRPDLCRTCCKQVAIRLNVQTYRISTGARKAMARCAVALSDGFGEPEQRYSTHTSASSSRKLPPRKSEQPASEASHQAIWGKGRGKGKYSQASDLERFFRTIAGDEYTPSHTSFTLAQLHKQRQEAAMAWRRAKKEQGNKRLACPLQPPSSNNGNKPKHTLTSRLFYGSSSAEKYGLFRRYQTGVHKESESKVSSRQGFERFLCESSLRREMPAGLAHRTDHKRGGKSQVKPTEISLTDTEPLNYGLYHLEWFLDDKELIAVSVIDILPRCVSAVYFFYDPAYEHLELGKISALREIELVKQLQRKSGMEHIQWYYLGFYIHTCQKMKYKAQYRPSQILDGETYQWWDFDAIKEKLDRGQSYSFQRSFTDFSHSAVKDSAESAAEAHKTRVSSSSSSTSDSDLESDSGSDSSDSESDSKPSQRYLPLDPTPPGVLQPLSLDPLRLVQEVLVLDSEDQTSGIGPAFMTPLASALLHPPSAAGYGKTTAKSSEQDRPPKQHEARLLRDAVAAVGWRLATGRSDAETEGGGDDQARLIFFV